MDVLIPAYIILGFATALAFSLACVPLIIQVASSYGLFDFPDTNINPDTSRRVHSTPTPRIGGIAIFCSFFVTNVIWARHESVNAIFLVSIAIFLMGLVDDVKHLGVRWKFLIQIFGSLAVVHFSNLALPFLALTPTHVIYLPPLVGYFLSTFIIVGAMNAINMIDGLDGLAGGVTVISVALLSLVYYVRSHDITVLAIFSIPMLGAILGFLKYNTHPASIFMGDSGSNWLGFMVGVLLLLVLGNFSLASGLPYSNLTPSDQNHFPLVSGILCLAVPIFDAASVIFSRLKNGLHPMRADKRHFHHTLLHVGLTHSQSVTAIYFVALVIGIFGVLPSLFPRYEFWWLPYFVLIMLFVFMTVKMKSDGMVMSRLATYILRIDRTQQRSPTFTKVVRRWEQFNRYCIYSIFAISPAFAGVIRPEVGYAACGALFIILVSFLLKKDANDFAASLALSLGAFVLLIANNQNSIQVVLMGEMISLQFLYNWIFIVLFGSTFLLLALTIKKNYLIITPSDFLLTIMPLFLLITPEPFRTEYRLDIIALRSFIVFAALRVMVKKRNLALKKLRVVNGFALIYVIVVSLFGLRIVY